MQLQSLSPWELRLLWNRVLVFAINKAASSSSKLVRVGLKGLLVVIDTVFCNFAAIKKALEANGVVQFCVGHYCLIFMR